MKLLGRMSQLKSLGEESGQAILEYILMAFISFLIISGLLYNFNEGMRDYIDSFFSGYLVCLLETGELPSLGNEGGGAVCQGGQFDMARTNPGAGEGLDGSGDGSGTGGDSASDGSDSSSSSSRRRRSRRSSRNADAGGGSTAGGVNGSSRPGTQRVQTSNLDTKVGGEESSSYTGSSAASSSTSSRRAAGRNGRGGRVASFGFAYIEEDKKEKEQNRAPASRKVKDGKKAADAAGRAKKIGFTPPPPQPKKGPETNDEGMDFSKYLKWIIIAGLIVAIVVFVGGQGLNITKGWNTK